MSCCRAALTITLTYSLGQIQKRGEWCVSIARWPCLSYWELLCALQHCLSPAPPQRPKRLCPFLHRCSILLNLSFSLLPGEALPKPIIPQNAHSMQNTRSVVLSSLAVVVLSLYKSPVQKKKSVFQPGRCSVLCCAPKQRRLQ